MLAEKHLSRTRMPGRCFLDGDSVLHGWDGASVRKRSLLVATAALLTTSLCAFTIAGSSGAFPSVPASEAFPLKVSENQRYLVDQRGTPFLIVADSPQGLIGSLSEADAEYYFADRQRQGFNALGWMDVVCAGRDFPTNPYATTPDGLRPFTGFVGGGNDYNHYDLSKPNEAYFLRLDHILHLALNHHLAVFLNPIETIGWLGTLRNNGINAAYGYGQFLGNRYRGFKNVLWINGNDFDTWSAGKDGALMRSANTGIRAAWHTWNAREDDALVQSVARGIRSVAPQQLQTVELQPLNSSSSDDPDWIPLIDLNSTYTYSPAYMQMLYSYDQRPVEPTFLVETFYEMEGHPNGFGTPIVLRKQAYWTMLSGGVGQFYGNSYTWSFRNGWKGYIDTPGVEQIGYWKGFFLSLNWQNLVPDQNHSILLAGAGFRGELSTNVSDCDYATAARTPDGSTIAIYIPTRRTINVNMASMSNSARARWFDPSSGTYQEVPGEPFVNNGSQQFTPPGNNHVGDQDWVLLLTASGAKH